MNRYQQPVRTEAEHYLRTAEACRANAIQERQIARDVGQLAENEPDLQKRVDLYREMLDWDLHANALETHWAPVYEAKAEAAEWAR